MITRISDLKNEEVIALLIKAVAECTVDDITAYSSEILTRMRPDQEPVPVFDITTEKDGLEQAEVALGLRLPQTETEHPVCPTCKGVKTWIGDRFICNHCDRRLCPDGGGNPIPGEFVQMDGGGVAFQEDVVPDGGDQMRITGGNPPECPRCRGGMMPDESVYRCVTCGHVVGDH